MKTPMRTASLTSPAWLRALALPALLLLPGGIACGSTFEDCNRTNSCPPDSGTTGSDGGGTTGGTDGGGTGGAATDTGAGGMTGAGNGGDGGAGGAPSCDSAASPTDEPCLVSDDFAVFVSPSGDDDGDDDGGTMDAPVATFERALELAGEDEKIVIACSGEYDERVVIGNAARVYGSFDCENDWAYTPEEPTTIAPSAREYALEVNGADGQVVIQDITFLAQDGQDPGESSIAAFVRASESVLFRRVRLQAGQGADGADGELLPFEQSDTPTASDDDFPSFDELNGNNANTTTGGAEKECVCPGGMTTVGGKGGDGGVSPQGGDDGQPDYPSEGGEGGVVGSCGNGVGDDGENAPDTNDVPGAQVLGSLTSDGWFAQPGTDGLVGMPGQGGGGGAGAATGGGGGGGCGGCGGASGGRGQGGGASIAILVLNSSVIFEASDLIANQAGNGGDGVAGQDAQFNEGLDEPAHGFAGNPATGACQGGFGADGGTGGGGAGGVSPGIVWRGETEPAVDRATDITTDDAGDGGLGGEPVAIEGENADVLEVT
jgi:hypothetical protein